MICADCMKAAARTVKSVRYSGAADKLIIVDIHDSRSECEAWVAVQKQQIERVYDSRLTLGQFHG